MSDRDETMLAWWRELCAELGVDDPGTDVERVLDLAAVAAHAVVRPAAPLTTFLAGYAAGLAGGGDERRPSRRGAGPAPRRGPRRRPGRHQRVALMTKARPATPDPARRDRLWA
ncbi:MAG: DUF6457 domain-containing protein [Aeromicrobium erythreum]